MRAAGEMQPESAEQTGRSADELRSLAIAKCWEQLAARAAEIAGKLDDSILEFRLRSQLVVTLPLETDPYRVLGSESSASTATIKKLRLRLAQVIEQLRQRDGLKVFQRLAGRTLVALNGTEYFCLQKLSCLQCLVCKRANGKTEHYHAMLAAMIVAPGHNVVLPLMPELVTPQDGAEKQDCERNAARRWLSAHHARVAGLRPVYLGDALFSCQRWPKRCWLPARIFCLCRRKTATRRCTSLSKARHWTGARSPSAGPASAA